MTWVVVSDPVPGGATILGSGLGRDSAHRHPHREAQAAAPGRVRGAQLRGLPQLLRIPAARQARDRVHRAPEQPGPLRAAADAGRGDVRAGDASAKRRTRRWRWRREAAARAAALLLRCVLRVAPRRCGAAELRRGARPRTGRPTSRCSTATACRSRRCASTRPVRRLPWVPLDDMSPALLQAIVLSEDQRFYEHSGVDWARGGDAAPGRNAVEHAHARRVDADDAARRPDRRRPGAPGRRAAAWRRRSARRSPPTQLEAQWKKSEILEAYLNSVPFRGELVGIDALAQTLFGKHPSGLDAHEAAIAAALVRGAERAAPSAVAQRACGVLRAAAARLRRRDRR